MNNSKIAASTLAAVVAVSGIGGILVARHTPGNVEAVELPGDTQWASDHAGVVATLAFD